MSTTKTAVWLALLGPSIALTAHAEIFMSDAQAAALIFPGEKMEKSEILLSATEAEKIKQLSGEKVRNKTLTLWKSPQKNVVYIDQVLGKHEFITYAVGITKEGHVKGVEILEYRESYGGKVRENSWRKQFNGKDKTASFKLDEDIKNISGATLSCSHITTGVKRILLSHDATASRL